MTSNVSSISDRERVLIVDTSSIRILSELGQDGLDLLFKCCDRVVITIAEITCLIGVALATTSKIC